MSDLLDTVSAFVAVADHGSFAAAARRLNRTPAGITRAVAALEQQLATRLFNRTTRSVALTDEGAQYLDAARRLLAARDEMTHLEAGESAEPHGTLSLTAPAMFGRLHVLPVAAAFMDRYPRVEVRALLLDRVVSLIDEGMDVAIRLGPLPDSSLRAVRVGQIRAGVFASPAYLHRHGTPQTPADLAGHAAISCAAVTPQPDRWPFAGGAMQAVRPRMVVNTADAAADAAAAGLGPTYLMCYQTDSGVQAGRLVEVLAGHATAPVPIHLVHPAGRYTPAKVRRFIEMATETLRRRFAV